MAGVPQHVDMMLPGKRVLRHSIYMLLMLMLEFGPVVAAETFVPRLYLYSSEQLPVFLGCLNCRRSDPDSVWNPRGRFGSAYGERSIWNSQGRYGNPTSPFSPWHAASTQGPVIRDSRGRNFGRFSRSFDNQTTHVIWLEWILEHHALVLADLPAYRAHFSPP